MNKSDTDPTAQNLRKLIPHCLLCQKELSGHRYLQVAVTVANERNKHRVEEIFRRVRQHDWAGLAEFRDFQSDENGVVVYAVTGAHKDGLVAVVLSPFELYEPSQLYFQEIFLTNELEQIRSLAPIGEWQDF